MNKKIMFSFILLNTIIFANGIQLPTTTITTTGFNDTLIKENKNITLITKEDIEKKNYNTIEDILRDSPNVVIQNSQFGPVVNLRGSGDRSMSRVKVLVDGVAINPLEEAMGTLPINSVPVGAIEKIEIIPGGGATLYGSGTTGGVVNIITKTDLNSNYHQFNVRGGSYSKKDIDIAIGQNLTENLYVNVAGQYINKDGYRDRDEVESSSFSGGINYKINDREKVRLQGTYFEDDGKTSTEVLKSILEKDRKAQGFDLDYNSKRESLSLDYENRVTDNLTLYSNIFYTNYDREFVQKDRRDFQIPKIKNMPFDILLEDLNSTLDGKFKEETYGIKLKSKYEYDKGTLVLGYDYSKTNMKRDSLVVTEEFKFSDAKFPDFPQFRPEMIENLVGKTKGKVVNDSRMDIDKDTHGVYALNNYNLSEKLVLTTGLRYEYTEYSGDRSNITTMYGKDISGSLGGIIFPTGSERELSAVNSKVDRKFEDFAGEIGLNYQFSEVGSVYTRYERGFITPLPSQLTNKISTKDRGNIYTDSGINPENIDSIEFGVKNIYGNTFINASVFASQTRDEIITIDQNANNPAIKTWQFVNIDKTRRVGGELYAQHYFDKLTLTESLTYVNAEIEEVSGDKKYKKGDKVPMVSEWKVTLGVDYALTDKMTLGATYTYNSGYEKRELETFDKTKVSGYGVTDIFARYDVNENFVVKLGINNLFDEEYNYYESATTAIVAPERNYYAGVMLTF